MPTNRVAGSGRAHVTLCGNRATVDVTVSGVPRRVQQAMHVRVNGRGARPAASSTTQLNGRTALSTTDGHPAYGMIGKSLTTRGDTSPASAFAIARFPVGGSFHYQLRTITPALCGVLRGFDGPSLLVDRPVWDHARMDFNLAPPTGIGPLRIGMARHAANTALDSLRDLSAISESDRAGQHVFRPSGLMISIHCMRDMLEAVELGRPLSQTDRVLFQGVDVFALPAREVVRRMGEFTSIEEDPDDAASFIAPDLLLSFWRPFAADDEPEEEQGYHFSSVLLARPGYYDTPAQAAERLQQSVTGP
ncbi:hypothetical protein [Streptomyces sp. NPDC056132]|uniref:hypothetical protein n=1 Tax=Streptomyces sp. NPDC056132 TaxID=3345722 RepID=UPI0035E12EAB